MKGYERGSIVVRADASHAEGLRFEPDSMPWLNARSLFTQQQMGAYCEHWGDKGGEEGNWPPYLTCRWLRISFLSNRHSPTYESIWDYLNFYERLSTSNFKKNLYFVAPLSKSIITLWLISKNWWKNWSCILALSLTYCSPKIKLNNEP